MASNDAEAYAAKFTRLTEYGIRADWQMFISNESYVCPAVALNQYYLLTSASCLWKIADDIVTRKRRKRPLQEYG